MAAGGTATTDCEPSLRNIIEQTSLKWVFVGGKGGVGKTTTSCSLAIQLSKVRVRVLLVSIDPAHSLSDAFGQKFSMNPQLVDGFTNLYAMESKLCGPEKKQFERPVDPSSLEGNFETMFDKMTDAFSGSSCGLPFDMVIFRRLLSMEYSVIVFDMAPTGHALQSIGLPILMGKYALENKVFTFFQQQVSRLMKMESTDWSFRVVADHLRDPQKTTFVGVCIAEYLSLYETERMIQELTKLGIDTHNVVVNQLHFPRAGDQSCALCSSRRKLQKKYLEQIEILYQDVHVTKLPLLGDEVRGVDMLEPFSEYILHPYIPKDPCSQHPENPPAP